jgi:hypothetical protein
VLGFLIEVVGARFESAPAAPPKTWLVYLAVAGVFLLLGLVLAVSARGREGWSEAWRIEIGIALVAAAVLDLARGALLVIPEFVDHFLKAFRGLSWGSGVPLDYPGYVMAVEFTTARRFLSDEERATLVDRIESDYGSPPLLEVDILLERLDHEAERLRSASGDSLS